MVRVLIYLLIVGVLACATVWLADRPGDVVITWQSMRLETSLMVLTVSVAAIAVSSVLFWIVVRALMRSPDVVRGYFQTRRNIRGYQAISQGLIAVGSGDVRAARKFALEAAKIAPKEPLTLLLGAQASQLSGARDAAAITFHAMASRDDTRLLGLHGLFIEAQRRHDAAAAQHFAEEAAQNPRAPAWAAIAVFDARCITGDWNGALERLDHNMKSGLVDRDSYRRQRAVLLTARALEAHSQDDRANALALALEAVKLAPTLVPAAALAGRLQGESGDMRRAARTVEAAWKANPHPDLAVAYAHLRPGDSARDRLTRVKALAEKTPGNVESALALARAALDAHEFAIARQALTPLSITPSQRVAVLMAELEEKQHGDEGRAREWMTRAVRARHDPAWTADGMVSDRWMPVSPVTGRLDAFQWKDPIAELDVHVEPVIEYDRGPRVAIAAPNAARAPDGPVPNSSDATTSDTFTAASPAPLPRPTTTMPIASIVPLVHVPDDPGPDAPAIVEPETETPPEPQSDSWRKLRGLFTRDSG